MIDIGNDTQTNYDNFYPEQQEINQDNKAEVPNKEIYAAEAPCFDETDNIKAENNGLYGEEEEIIAPHEISTNSMRAQYSSTN